MISKTLQWNNFFIDLGPALYVKLCTIVKQSIIYDGSVAKKVVKCSLHMNPHSKPKWGLYITYGKEHLTQSPLGLELITLSEEWFSLDSKLTLIYTHSTFTPNTLYSKSRGRCLRKVMIMLFRYAKLYLLLNCMCFLTRTRPMSCTWDLLLYCSCIRATFTGNSMVVLEFSVMSYCPSLTYLNNISMRQGQQLYI